MISLPATAELVAQKRKLELDLDVTVTKVVPYQNDRRTIHYRVKFPYHKGRYFHIPLGYAQEHLPHYLITPKPALTIDQVFEQIPLRDYQKDFLQKELVPKNVYAWSLEPGFGKTWLAMAFIKYWGLSTTILVHRKQLKIQWEATLKEANVEATVIMVADLKALPKHIECLIVDEAHACCTQTSCPILSQIEPQILLGMSATFWRYEHLGIWLKWFFGTPTTFKPLTRSGSITVYVIRTGITPELENVNGMLSWSRITSSLATNVSRNQLIAGLVEQNSDRNILIFVKLVQHANELGKLIADAVVITGNVDYKIGSMPKIIIATTGKLGVGVSINHMDCLILACDIFNYSIQYISRVLRTIDKNVVIYDLLDNFSSLEKHFGARQKEYQKLGADIKNYINS